MKIGLRSAFQRFASERDQVRAEAGDRDFAARSVLQPFGKIAGGLSMTTCELPEMADGGLRRGCYITPAFVGGVGQPFTEVIIHVGSPYTYGEI